MERRRRRRRRARGLGGGVPAAGGGVAPAGRALPPRRGRHAAAPAVRRPLVPGEAAHAAAARAPRPRAAPLHPRGARALTPATCRGAHVSCPTSTKCCSSPLVKETAIPRDSPFFRPTLATDVSTHVPEVPCRSYIHTIRESPVGAVCSRCELISTSC